MAQKTKNTVDLSVLPESDFRSILFRGIHGTLQQTWHLVDSGTEEKKKRGRPPKKHANPRSDYQLAIACHLASNKPCLERYSDSESFKILSCCRSRWDLERPRVRILKDSESEYLSRQGLFEAR